MDQTFFHLILDKVFNTTVVTTSLIIYSKREKKNILLGVLIGFLVNVIIYSTGIKLNNLVQLMNSVAVALLSTRMGIQMIQKKREDLSTRLILFLLPICFMINQGLGVSHKAYAFTMTLSSIGLCGLFGLAYYSTVTHFSQQFQTSCCCIVIYLTGAIAVSKLFGCLEQIIDPPLKNLVFIIREQQSTTNLIRLLFGTSDWNGTGYSIYWFMISIYLIYSAKK